MGFDSFASSPEHLAFKSSMLPFVTGPADLQLFESPNAAFHTAPTSPLYVHVTKPSAQADISDESQTSQKVFESQWAEFVAQINSASSLPLATAFRASGLRDQEGAFLGITGWEDLQVSGEWLGAFLSDLTSGCLVTSSYFGICGCQGKTSTTTRVVGP